jgi:hypothetical protein
VSICSITTCFYIFLTCGSFFFIGFCTLEDGIKQSVIQGLCDIPDFIIVFSSETSILLGVALPAPYTPVLFFFVLSVFIVSAIKLSSVYYWGASYQDYPITLFLTFILIVGSYICLEGKDSSDYGEKHPN